MIPILFLLSSCFKKEFPDHIFGEWTTGVIDITVRIEPRLGQFEFITGKGIITFTINQDQTVDGQIGMAKFEDATFVKNWGKPGADRIDISIQCGYISEIFKGDPLSNKEVEIWMGPIEDRSDAELRYTEGMADFPMASFVLEKTDQ